jgi:hypothetical protein
MIKIFRTALPNIFTRSIPPFFRIRNFVQFKFNSFIEFLKLLKYIFKQRKFKTRYGSFMHSFKMELVQHLKQMGYLKKVQHNSRRFSE